jgi:hypothetical protein
VARGHELAFYNAPFSNRPRHMKEAESVHAAEAGSSSLPAPTTKPLQPGQVDGRARRHPGPLSPT